MPPRIHLDVEQLRREYEREGLSLYRIAERHGVAYETVHTRLSEAGVQMRPRVNPLARDLDAEQLRHEYEAGDFLKTVAERHGVSVQTVRQLLDTVGTQLRPSSRADRSPKDLDAEQLRREYEAGDSLRTIAQRHGASVRTVRQLLDTVDAQIRPQGRYARKTPDIDAMRREYEAGDSLTTIAQRHGATRRTVRARLVEAGAQIRRKGARRYG